MMTLNDLCVHLLPPDEHLKFKTLHIDEQGITLVATMTSPKSACPDCHQLASRIHSSYPRTLADVPWAITPIELRLTVRRFFCTTCTCGRSCPVMILTPPELGSGASRESTKCDWSIPRPSLASDDESPVHL
jgi:transposase